MGCGPYEAFQSCRDVVGRAESPGVGSRQWRVAKVGLMSAGLFVVGGGGTRMRLPQIGQCKPSREWAGWLCRR